MPRRSAASLSVVPPVGPKRPEPPSGLTPDQVRHWQAIVSEMPPDFFITGSLPLLAAYVRHVSIADLLGKAINATDLEADLDRYDQLTRMACRESGMLATLAQKMRLAQSARYESKKRAPVTSPSRRPWEHAVETRGIEQLKRELARLDAAVAGRLARNAAMASTHVMAARPKTSEAIAGSFVMSAFGSPSRPTVGRPR
jgi:hypothetical protein